MDGMVYEDVKPHKTTKKVTTKFTKKLALQEFDRVGTWTIVGMLLKRHKYGLVVNLFVIENILLGAKFFGII